MKNKIGPYLQNRLHEVFEGHPIVGEAEEALAKLRAAIDRTARDHGRM